MTISTETARSGPYLGTGLNTSFAYRFRIDSASHLRVLRIDAASGAETTLALGADYQVSGIGEAAGGAVTLATALKSGQQLIILRDQPFTQGLDLVNQGPFFAEDIEAAFDRGVMRDQQLAEGLSRAVTVPPGDSTAPADYLAQMQSILNQVLANAQSGSQISVITQGAEGDRETNDLAAFQAARDKAVELGLDYVVIPVPPDPDDWYFVLGDIEGVTDVRWIMDPRAAVNGSTNLFAERGRIKGAQLWNPTVTHSTVWEMEGLYNHQPQIGTDLDGEWIITWQASPDVRTEGKGLQIIRAKKSIDGGLGESWSDLILPFTSAEDSTNPVDFTGTNEKMWRSNVLNFQPYGLGNKVWNLGGWGRGSQLYPSVVIAQKTQAAGPFTTYGLFQEQATGRVAFHHGVDAPVGWTRKFVFEGRDGLWMHCHDWLIDSQGRLLMLMVNVPTKSGQIFSHLNDVFVLHSENPGEANPEDIVFTVGPGINHGGTDLGSPWEWSITEESPGFFTALRRRNEKDGTQGESEGRWHWVAFGDGVNFSGWQPAGMQAHRDRPSFVRLNHEHSAYVTFDIPVGRTNVAAWLKRRNAGVTPGLRISNEDPLAKARDTLFEDAEVGQKTATSTLSFSSGRVLAEWWRSAGERIDLTSEGYIADWEANQVDFRHQPFSVGDTLVAEQGRQAQDFAIPADTITTLDVEFDLTAVNSAAGVTLWGLEGDDSIAIPFGSEPGNALVGTAADQVTVYGTGQDFDVVRVEQNGQIETRVALSPGDTLFPLDGTMDIAEGSFQARVIQGSEQDTIVSPFLGFHADTGSSQVTLFHDRSANDILRLTVQRGERAPVSTGTKNQYSGALGVTHAVNRAYLPGVGGEGIRFARIDPSGFPRSDMLNVIPRSNAAVEFSDSGHSWSHDAGSNILTLNGAASAGVDLPAGRWQVSGRWRLSELPSGIDPARILALGNFERFASLEASYNEPHLNRDLFLIDQAGGVRNIARTPPLERNRIHDVGVWMGWTFRYDSYRGEVTIEGHTLPLQWPFTLLLGDGYLLSEAPTTRALEMDLASIVAIEVPEDHREWTKGQDPTFAKNLALDPGFERDAERNGTGYPSEAPRAFLSGWALHDIGDATVTPRQTRFSLDAANRQQGGWETGLQIECTKAGSSEIRFQYAWPDVRALVGRPWFVMLDLWDARPPAEGERDYDSGISVLIDWVQNFGLGGDKEQVTSIAPIRAIRDRQREPISLPIPQVDETNKTLIGPGSFCALRFVVEAGREFDLRIARLDVYAGDKPREWVRPDPNEEDRTLSYLYPVEPERRGLPVATGQAVSASKAAFLFPLPDMNMKPDLRVQGGWAVNTSGTLKTGTPTLAEADEKRALVAVDNLSGLVPGDQVFLEAISQKSVSHIGDGTLDAFTAEDMLVLDEGDVEVVKETVGGSTTLSFPADYDLRLSFAQQRDVWIAGTGDSVFTTELVLPNFSTPDLVSYNDQSGENTLAVDTDFTGTIVGEEGTGGSITLTSALPSGAELALILQERLTGAEVLLTDPLTAGETLHITHARETDASLQFDARFFRPQWQIRAATSALYDAFVVKPGVRRRDYIDRLIAALQDAGIWDLKDVYYCLAAHDQASGLLNWKDPASFAASLEDGATFVADRGGVTDGVASSVQAAWVPSTDAVAFTQNSAHVAFFVYSLASDVGSAAVGGVAGSGGRASLIARFAPRRAFHRMTNADNTESVSVIDGRTEGYFALDRAAADAYRYLAEGGDGRLRVQSYPAASHATLPDSALMMGRISNAYGKAEGAFMSAGGSMTDQQHRIQQRAERQYLRAIGALT
ncbi:MAG: hypothetical protein AAFY02_13895 [Pseudomonadota bacterium]